MSNYKIVVELDGMKSYYLDEECNVPHRTDGPAFEYINGFKEWYQNGLRHREDGPAVEWADGSYEWFSNDKIHRLDGPAIKHSRENIFDYFWYYEGVYVDCDSQEEFERLVKMKAFW